MEGVFILESVSRRLVRRVKAGREPDHAAAAWTPVEREGSHATRPARVPLLFRCCETVRDLVLALNMGGSKVQDGGVEETGDRWRCLVIYNRIPTVARLQMSRVGTSALARPAGDPRDRNHVRRGLGRARRRRVHAAPRAAQ